MGQELKGLKEGGEAKLRAWLRLVMDSIAVVKRLA